jgi:class 3 adenylate cyclase
MTMKFSELTQHVRAWLRRQGRVSYRALRHEFELNDEDLADLKAELIDARRVAADEDGKVLVWRGNGGEGETTKRGNGEKEVVSSQYSVVSPQPLVSERRQLTVMFCDLVGSTTLSERLDPEDFREVMQAYNEVCAAVIKRFDGYLAKYLGDGLLVYFGYPTAHEDDAQRAVRAGLEIISAITKQVSSPLAGEHVLRVVGGGQGEGATARVLQVRIGIHTGLVVAGEVGAGDTRESLAIVGETPNLAARLQGLAAPDTVVISAATQRLVEGFFTFRELGVHSLKGYHSPRADRPMNKWLNFPPLGTICALE